MQDIALTAGKKRILILCGDEIPAITAANIYADLLSEHELCFLEEKNLSWGRVKTFTKRRLHSKGIFSVIGSFAYYARLIAGAILSQPAAIPKNYHPKLTVENFNTDPAIKKNIQNFKPDVALVCFCSVLNPEILALLPKATYNIHPGINPRYRGFGNIWAAYENNFDCFGYTIHSLDEGIDTGERITVKAVSVQDLANVPFADIDTPVIARAANHLAQLLLGEKTPHIPEVFQELPSHFYGLPTIDVFYKARKNFIAALKKKPRHILITGASSGIGKALAEAYAENDVTLTLWARDQKRLEETAALCKSKGAKTFLISQDIRDLEVCRSTLAHIHKEHPISLAILGAGVSSGTLPDGSLESASDACRTMNTNATASINMMGTLFELMRQEKSKDATKDVTRQIACISSLAALYPLPDSPSYSAAKVALAYYAKAMRPHVKPIKVSVIYPGYVDSPMSRRLSGPQPMRWTTKKAAAHIKKRLDPGADAIVFPWPLALGTLLLHLLPTAIATFFARSFGFSITPDAEAGNPKKKSGKPRV